MEYCRRPCHDLRRRRARQARLWRVAGSEACVTIVEGSRAPKFHVEGLTGQKHELGDYLGRPFLLIFLRHLA